MQAEISDQNCRHGDKIKKLACLLGARKMDNTYTMNKSIAKVKCGGKETEAGKGSEAWVCWESGTNMNLLYQTESQHWFTKLSVMYVVVSNCNPEFQEELFPVLILII